MAEGCVPWPAEAAEKYRRAGYWRGIPLGHLLRRLSVADPRRPAIVAHGRRIGYAELDGRADRLAAGLVELGLRPGDRIIVQLPNSPALIEVLIASFRVGILPVLALAPHRFREVGYMAQYSEAVAYIAPDVLARYDYRDLARELVGIAPTVRHVIICGDPGPFTSLADIEALPRDLAEPDPSGPAFFLLSGGTTGAPKLIPRTHDDYMFQMRETAAAMGFDSQGVYLAALPVAHNAALGCPGVLGALRAGGKVVLADSPSPEEVFPLISAERVTLTTLMPAYLSLWIEFAGDFDADLSGLTIEVGGAWLDPQVARQVRPVLGATLTHWFGMAEGPLCFTRPGGRDELAATTQGHPLCQDDEMRIVDEEDRDVQPGEVGELLYRGPTTVRGYYRAEEYNVHTFTPGGYLRTGDLVSLTADGALVVEGRVKDVINRGGEKIGAEEVEQHLLTHRAVAAAAVIAVPDAVLGEKTCAVVVPRGRPVTLGQLKSYLFDRGVADYKFPDRLELVEALPYTSVGKVDKKALRAVYGISTADGPSSQPSSG